MFENLGSIRTGRFPDAWMTSTVGFHDDVTMMSFSKVNLIWAYKVDLPSKIIKIVNEQSGICQNNNNF